ncbi:MAG: branched-chain amino acid transaminase [Flavobacteriales bacterium]|jgi:branched-chain amino acid aminotransferase|nr:branched-chain amino acid transaminase [Flavobacteriales bacterium]
MKEERKIWFKNQIVPLSQATINVLAPTSQFGANVFEGHRAYWNEEQEQLYIFRLDEHIKRLKESIKLIKFEDKYSTEFLKQSCKDIIIANDYQEDIAIRQTVFLDGFGSWFSTDPVEMFIAPIPKGRLLNQNKTGVHCCVSSWERINDNSVSPRIKVGANYINSRAGQLEAKRNNYDFAIFLNNQGFVSEGPGSCLFMVKDDVLITPSTTSSILDSITRKTILQIAKEDLNLHVEEREVNRTELYTADELFLCGTAVEIVPILSIDRYEINQQLEGKLTEKIKNHYFDIARGKILDRIDWLTPVY